LTKQPMFDKLQHCQCGGAKVDNRIKANRASQ
jgi:hypothetical protein